MSKVMIVSLTDKNKATYKREPLVMTWEEYQVFCRQVAGEGETWKAVLTW